MFKTILEGIIQYDSYPLLEKVEQKHFNQPLEIYL
jgi:hypothetical protein